MKHLRSNDAAIEQREREINGIAEGIIELADIFKNLQTMVIDQGTMLDRIDYNVEKMAVDVKGAQKELVTVRDPTLFPPQAKCSQRNHPGHQLPAQVHQAKDLIPAPPPRHRHVHPLTSQAQTTQRFVRDTPTPRASTRRR